MTESTILWLLIVQWHSDVLDLTAISKSSSDSLLVGVVRDTTNKDCGGVWISLLGWSTTSTSGFFDSDSSSLTFSTVELQGFSQGFSGGELDEGLTSQKFDVLEITAWTKKLVKSVLSGIKGYIRNKSLIVLFTGSTSLLGKSMSSSWSWGRLSILQFV